VTPPFRINWHEAAKADIRKLDRATAIFSAIEHFALTASGDAKPLRGDVMESWRLCAGDYRVLFAIQGDLMHIGGVRHRSEAYR
jgi:mRNA-degrading endonuclease RelE of RelBE toxin-antitoxin system